MFYYFGAFSRLELHQIKEETPELQCPDGHTVHGINAFKFCPVCGQTLIHRFIATERWPRLRDLVGDHDDRLADITPRGLREKGVMIVVGNRGERGEWLSLGPDYAGPEFKPFPDQYAVMLLENEFMSNYDNPLRQLHSSYYVKRWSIETGFVLDDDWD